MSPSLLKRDKLGRVAVWLACHVPARVVIRIPARWLW